MKSGIGEPALAKTIIAEQYVTCLECGWMGLETHLLTDVNPFRNAEMIRGCPFCRCINQFANICQQKGCKFKAKRFVQIEKNEHRVCEKHYWEITKKAKNDKF